MEQRSLLSVRANSVLLPAPTLKGGTLRGGGGQARLNSVFEVVERAESAVCGVYTFSMRCIIRLL